MLRRSLLSLIIPVSILLSSTASFAESRLALVIGQSAYKSVPALPNPANDAKAVTQMLTESGFTVTSASDLSQDEMRAKISDFAGEVAARGADTVALVFYAGHGLQIDGENYLIPVDIDPKREADIPIQAVRLNDILNTLTSVPSRMRILLLDACRNNPFPELSKTAGHGLAIIDAKVGAPGTFVSFSTSPGAEAEDGSGSNSPYTTALLATAKEPGIPIEDTFKRVRLAVNKATDGRQTPWDSSSLTEDFRFTAGAATPPLADAPKPAATKPEATKRTVADWKRELRGKPVEAANELIVVDGTDEAYEAFVALYAGTPRGLQARDWLDRHRRMVAWNNAVLANTAAAYRAFLAQYPDSDLTATARKLIERLRYRPDAVAAATNVALAGPTCPCNAAPPQPKKADAVTKKRADREPPPRSRKKRYVDDGDVVVVREPPPPVVYAPVGPPIGVGIGIGIGGGYGRYGGGGVRRGGY
ncbi:MULTISPECIES: caspase family protein [unclassified Bradyrhizobium]|uniref:caspase family protein n=1 Tax=unclassified Bradyrhizobium TaxID=2631580 RepID=UPI00247989F6|nr:MULTISPECIES: caspase family protein [unclassified Bradyrhizobium]WGS23094.1 caspase family protein [Bradyrhizobium sp. ISRA463]WGS30097.1 caspase family protein [Bradyrhizobium sp. ISRA464]